MNAGVIHSAKISAPFDNLGNPKLFTLPAGHHPTSEDSANRITPKSSMDRQNL